ncbi:MAG TPA: glycerate kinase [Kamptonema sp.]|nr:glycerate kinase [Kamptonema sp.]
MIEILEGWIAGKQPVVDELQRLAVWEVADRARSRAFGITTENVNEIIRARSDLFQSVVGAIYQLPLQSTNLLETLWNLWLPLAMQLATERQSLGRNLIQGILGGQGTGKTTLAAVLKLILGKLGYSTIGLSLDDIYKTYAERQQLKEEDPRLIWRGPPGTHDIELGIKVLDRLRECNNLGLQAGVNGTSDSHQVNKRESENPNSILIPRFDKSAWRGAGDRTNPEIVFDVDIVLFEGWFVGVKPIENKAFDIVLPPILTEEDRQFGRDMNKKLRDYLPLWERLDRLIVLYPMDYRLSQVWRCQAEREMIAAGKSGMSNEEINQFVEYFWKALHPELFIKPLASNSEGVNLVIEINADHSVGRVY